jgi:hypothetical protein
MWRWTPSCLLLLSFLTDVSAYASSEKTPSSLNTPAPSPSNVADANFIRMVEPTPGSSTSETTIKIYFKQDMNPDSLNKGTITIEEIKHSIDLSCSYRFKYDQILKTLIMEPKNPYFNFGTGNAVIVTVSGGIQNQAGKPMGTDYTWTFRTEF